MINRRQLLKDTFRGITALTGLSLLERLALSQSSGVLRLNPTLSLVTDVGTNVVVLSAGDGLVLVDAGAPEFTASLIKHLSEISPGGPVRTVFNTHFHLENTGGNETLSQTGAKIVAHEITREWMATPYWVPSKDRFERARPKSAHPTTTFYTSGFMMAGTEKIDYGYLIEAHTSGDIYVHFRDSNVVAAGDVVSPVRDPELDYFTGAWIGGRIDAMDRLLKLADDRTRIVPGYGPVMNRAELQAERDTMKMVYDRTVDRVREGDSAEDMLKAGVMNGLPRSFKDPKKFLYDVQKGLWAHHNKLAPNIV